MRHNQGAFGAAVRGPCDISHSANHVAEGTKHIALQVGKKSAKTS